MLNILSSQEMRDVENYTMNTIGISSSVLMERAALASFNYICKSNPRNIIIFAGNGNNGGDGIAIARMLLTTNINVDLILIGDRKKSTIENEKQYYSFNTLKNNLKSNSSIFYNLESVDISKYDVVVDALLGIGISRNLEGKYLDAVNMINSSNAYIYSLDIPTGINTDTGIVMGTAVKANETLCFSEYKLGLILNQGPDYSGKLSLFDVGIINSSLLTDSFNLNINLIHALENKDINSLIPERKNTGHKGTFGKILIIAGSSKMAGAALLSSKAAFMSGAGMVKLLSSEINREAILSCLPELIYDSYDSMTDKELDNNFSWADIIIIGPGLSVNDITKHLLSYTLENAKNPVIVDADAINILSDNMDLLKLRKDNSLITIITPHPGEFNKLFNNVSFINNPSPSNPEDIKAIAAHYGIIIVAKNAKTIISDGNEIFINMSGTNGMATAGSGDVLTGILAPLIYNMVYNHNNSVLLSTALAVYIHGFAGEKAAMDKSDYSMTASDIISNIYFNTCNSFDF